MLLLSPMLHMVFWLMLTVNYIILYTINTLAQTDTDQFDEVVSDIGTVMDDDSTTVQDDTNSSLSNLPAELLVKIFSYLPLCDKIRMQYVSPRFKHIMEVPSLWKDFVWPNYEPLQVCSVSKILKSQGEHVRRIFFPAHVTSANILEMVQHCTKVTHLSLPSYRNLSLVHLEEIIHTMKHLQQLDVFVDGTYMKSILATTTGVKKLTLRCDGEKGPFQSLLKGIKQQGDNLPSVINVHAPWICSVEDELLQFWSTWSSKLPALEIGLYDIGRVQINLYPSIPLMKFRFGPAATPPLIKLNDHGILGLQFDTFHFTDYDHYGEVRHSITALSDGFRRVKEHHFNHIINLYSVSNVDFSDMYICPGHLKQLAIACPNLERINIGANLNCLQNLKGLRAIVDKCKNLQGINLNGIQNVECELLLWELLSSVKKLTHLAIDLSMLTQLGNCDDVHKQKLIGLLKSCHALKALEITGGYCLVYSRAFLHSNFPSLVYVRLDNAYDGLLEYTITNCHQLKYLNYWNLINPIHHISLPSSNSCHLQQLCMRSNIDLSTASVHVLSAYGELEEVMLYRVRITTSAITTLISNSPNLILLRIILDDDYSLNLEDCKKTVSKKFSKHKLFTVGDFFIEYHYRYCYTRYHDLTYFKSLWCNISGSITCCKFFFNKL